MSFCSVTRVQIPQHKQRRLGAIAMMLVSVALIGCESKLASMSNEELADKMYECNSSVGSSPGFAIRCDNYNRECHARRENGVYAC